MSSEAPVSDNPAVEEKIPRPFGRLWLLRRLARGGMGEVFLAATKGIEGAERPCVVKIIRRDHATDRSFLARFLDEARVQAQLTHPGVAQILEAATDEDGEPYVVVEYVEGRSLGEVRTRAAQLGFRIAWPDAVAIAAAAAEALGHVHERTCAAGKPLGIVHRDLSPQNIMVGYGGDLKVIDFGTARAQNRRCHTISGVVFAKPGYVAPEVANGISGDFRVDLYALGIMFWELLAGRRFLQGDPNEHLAGVAKGTLKPPAIAALVGAPIELDHVIARLVAHDRDARYAGTQRAVSDLMKLLARAPSLPNGERGVRVRIHQLMYRLYPAEPARSRAEWSNLLKNARAVRESEEREPRSEAPAVSGAQPPSAPSEPRSAVPAAPDPKGGVFRHDPDALPGTRYRILRTIGEGATGIVYEALHLDLMRPVALKVLSAEHASSSKDATSFRREARAIARLSHPNLVMIHDFGQASDGRLYCAMELVDGEMLDRRLARQGALDWREAVAIGIASCRGLEAAHAAGVFHRDLKPANILLPSSPSRVAIRAGSDPAPRVKLLDFGIARAQGDAPEGVPSRLRSDFRITGTPEYMAPEQAGSASVDGRADIYALACVLYELCTGRLPFVAGSAVGIVELKSRGAPEPMRQRVPQRGLPAQLDRVLLKAMSPKPSDRFATVFDFRRELERVLAVPRLRRAVARAAGYAVIGASALFALGVLGSRAARVGARAAEQGEMRAAAANAALPSIALPPPPAQAPESPPLPEPMTDEASTQAPVTHVTQSPMPHVPALLALANQVSPLSVHGTAGSRAHRPASPVSSAHEAAAPVPIAPLASSAAATPTSPAAPDTALPTAPPRAPEAPEPLETRLAKGDDLLRSGHRESALLAFRELATQFPTHTRILKRWADAASSMHRWEETEQAIEQWVMFDAGAEPKLYLARVLGYRGRKDDAVRVLKDLLEDHPECDEARALLRDHAGPSALEGGRTEGKGRAADNASVP
jgi:eukaryotic-like serine/threonine-protein kinase